MKGKHLCFPYGRTVSSPFPQLPESSWKKKTFPYRNIGDPSLCAPYFTYLVLTLGKCSVKTNCDEPSRTTHFSHVVMLFWCTWWKLWNLHPIKECCKLWAGKYKADNSVFLFFPQSFPSLVRCSRASIYFNLAWFNKESFWSFVETGYLVFLIVLHKYGYNFIFPI